MPTKKYVETDGDKTELTIKYPFPLSVNDDAYVYFYDIAGEDAEQSGEILRRLTDTGAVGVLYLVDGDVNEKGNDSVNKRLVDRLASNPNIPVAVVLTKFDKLEEEFDENCHCLRGDAYDMLSKEYVGSELERNVNLASEEIKSYLTVKRINPEFDEETNVKYFGVSAFSTSDALDYEMVGDKSVCYLTHQCSAKRMELPVIWLLRQFGCII